MKRGTTDISKVMRGTIPITKVMRGTTLIWESVLPVVTSGLVLHLDAKNTSSYPGTGTAWNDISGNNNNFTWNATPTITDEGINLSDTLNLTRTANLSSSTTGTLVMWIRTTSDQSLFWDSSSSTSGGSYVGAYRVANKEYYSGVGSPNYFQDVIDVPNIYDYIRDGGWHMIEFKNINLSAFTVNQFNGYNGYTFGTGSQIGKIMYYNKVLTDIESQQNYDADQLRFIPQPNASPAWTDSIIGVYKSRVGGDGGELFDEAWLGHEMDEIGQSLWGSTSAPTIPAGGYKASIYKHYSFINNANYDFTVNRNLYTRVNGKPVLRFVNTDYMQKPLPIQTKWPRSLYLNVTWNREHAEGNEITFKTALNNYENDMYFYVSASGYISVTSYLYNEIGKTSGLTDADYINCKMCVVMEATTYTYFVNGQKIGTANKADAQFEYMCSNNPSFAGTFNAFKGDFIQQHLFTKGLSDAEAITLTTQ